MRILLTGGGTGGHITPLLAVAHELKSLDPLIEIVYIGERGSKFAELTSHHEAIDSSYTIFAGKFRRYHGDSFLTRLADVKTNILNLRDALYVVIGILQSWFLLGRLRPDVLLLKGGFVGVPVGLAAAVRKIPFITHDSDILPGLANRLTGRWAIKHAVAQPVEKYRYPKKKMQQVGVLVESQFIAVTPELQQSYKTQLKIPANSPVLLVTGGSSGAKRINEAIRKIVDRLLADYPSLYVIHQVGKGRLDDYAEYAHKRLTVIEFMRPMHVYTGAADVVVARASANTVAELGVQGKAVIVVASPVLSDGHQLRNAEEFERQGVAISVAESSKGADTEALDSAIRQLLNDPARRAQLANRLQSSTISDAAHKLAMLLLDVAKHKR